MQEGKQASVFCDRSVSFFVMLFIYVFIITLFVYRVCIIFIIIENRGSSARLEESENTLSIRILQPYTPTNGRKKKRK